MEDEEAQRVKTILRLSETEVMNITHFQRGNGLISTNNNNITVEFKASNLEKELITTDRQELLEILKRQDKKSRLMLPAARIWLLFFLTKEEIYVKTSKTTSYPANRPFSLCHDVS